MSKKVFIVIIVIILVIITGYFTTKRLQKNEMAKKEEKMENIKIESKVPKQWQDNGIFSKYYEKAYEKLQTLSLEEKIGQLFLICYPSDNSIEALKEYHFSGYLFFEKDFKNKTEKQVQEMIEKLQNASNIPLVIAVDEEGGEVVRISSNKNLAKSKFQSPRELYQKRRFCRNRKRYNRKKQNSKKFRN